MRGAGGLAGDVVDEGGAAAGEGDAVAADAQGVGPGRDLRVDALGGVQAVGRAQAVGIGDDRAGGVAQRQVQVIDQRARGVGLGGVIQPDEDGAEAALGRDLHGEVQPRAGLGGGEGLDLGGALGGRERALEGDEAEALDAVGRGRGDLAGGAVAVLPGIEALRAEEEERADEGLVGLGDAQRLAAPLAEDGAGARGEGRGHGGAVHREVALPLLGRRVAAQQLRLGLLLGPVQARGDDARARRDHVGADAAVGERPAAGEGGHAPDVRVLPRGGADGVLGHLLAHARGDVVAAQEADAVAVIGHVARVRHAEALGRTDDEGVLRVARVGADGVEVAHAVLVQVGAGVAGGEEGEEVLVLSGEAVD